LKGLEHNRLKDFP